MPRVTDRADDREPDRDRDALKLAIVVATTLAVCGLVVFHVTGVNGSPYHRWPWRWIDPLRVYPAMLLLAAPAVVAQWLVGGRGIKAAYGVPLLVASCFGLQLYAAGVRREPFDLAGHLVAVLNEPRTTSYFGDARFLYERRGDVRGWLAAHPRLMQHYNLHSRQKPPGPILYYWLWLRLLDNADRAAVAGAVALGVVASLGVAAVYLFAVLLTRNDRAAFFAATWFALMPATTLFFPTFDACYPIFTCAIAGAWLLALRSGRVRWAVGFGAALAVALFFSFSLLVLGALLIGWAVLEIAHDGRASLRRVMIASGAASLTMIGIYLILWLATGYDPIATFTSALRNQAALEATFTIPRPYPRTIPTDLLDFFLGSGWVSALLLLLWLTRAQFRAHAHVVIGLASVATVALTGLLACETSRVWLFLQPLVMLPLGLELARWGSWSRTIVFACLILLTGAVAQNMELLSPLLP